MNLVTDITFDISKTCCFSGHRPERLAANGSLRCPPNARLKSCLAMAIEDAINEGYCYFLTGMARGIDLWAVREVVALRLKYPHIKYGCVLPFKEQAKNYKGVELYDYHLFVNTADEVVYTRYEYRKGCYRERNTYMVEHSSKLIAVVDDYKSGTGQTIALAKKKGLVTRVIDMEANRELFKLQPHDEGWEELCWIR